MEAARKGNLGAQTALQGPECPDSLLYLLEWAYNLLGRSGIGLDGPAPLSYSTVEAWAKLTGTEPLSHEVEALMALDAVLRHPETAEAPEQPAKALRPWPTRQGA